MHLSTINYSLRVPWTDKTFISLYLILLRSLSNNTTLLFFSFFLFHSFIFPLVRPLFSYPFPTRVYSFLFLLLSVNLYSKAS